MVVSEDRFIIISLSFLNTGGISWQWQLKQKHATCHTLHGNTFRQANKVTLLKFEHHRP